MRMNVFSKLAYFSLAFALFMITPVYAAGNLTVTNGSLSSFSSSGDFWNTGMNVILNVSLNATVGDVNVSAILVNTSGTANISNITGIFVYNDSNSNAIIDPSEALLGSNTSLSISTNYSFVNFTTNLSVPKDTKRNILVAFNISRGAFRLNTTATQISINSSIRTGNAEIADNITISTGSINSTMKLILDMHSNATLTPRVVDTNVTEQKFIYTITPTSQNITDRIKIVIPTGYTLLDVTDVFVGTTRYNRSFDGTNASERVGITFGVTEFNLTFTTPGPTNQIKINFTVNTNVTAQTSAAFASKVFGNGLNFVDPDIYNEETNVTTQQIIQILSFGGNKTAALSNGTDYWEFTLNVNFTTNLSAGLIQFKMNNWTSSQGTINLTNDTVTGSNTRFYASLRNDSTITNNTRILNVTDNYNVTNGISFNTTSDVASPITNRVKHLVLRMTIPSGIPVSSNWWTVYSILFRSNPT